MATAMRVVGECQCVEHQGAARLKEIIKELQEQVRIAREVIDSLRMELRFSEADYAPEIDGDSSDRPVSSADASGTEEDQKGGEEEG
jgi:hypothetical protein